MKLIHVSLLAVSLSCAAVTNVRAEGWALKAQTFSVTTLDVRDGVAPYAGTSKVTTSTATLSWTGQGSLTATAKATGNGGTVMRDLPQQPNPAPFQTFKKSHDVGGFTSMTDKVEVAYYVLTNWNGFGTSGSAVANVAMSAAIK